MKVALMDVDGHHFPNLPQQVYPIFAAIAAIERSGL